MKCLPSSFNGPPCTCANMSLFDTTQVVVVQLTSSSHSLVKMKTAHVRYASIFISAIQNTESEAI